MTQNAQTPPAAGPLAGLTIIEMAGIGPGPFAAMMLADHGARVVRIERAGGGTSGPGNPEQDILLRNRSAIRVDLKHPEAAGLVRRLVRASDGLIEGYRPGVMERLGLGPDVCLKDNPALVYGRMTGWGQDGPLATAVGHDINYIALTGALHASGRAGGPPTPAMNLVGDFGGGGMLLAFGMVAALLHVKNGGPGQVIDAAMVDGSALLMSMMYSFLAMGLWRDARGVNMLDTGAHFYDTYETADGKHMAVGAIEPHFYARLLALTGAGADPAFAAQMSAADWPALKDKLAAIFRTRTRDDWTALLEGTDACASPVMSMTEAPDHPHLAARGTFTRTNGRAEPAPAPRYSATPLAPPAPAGTQAQALDDWLDAQGIDEREQARLRAAGCMA